MSEGEADGERGERIAEEGERGRRMDKREESDGCKKCEY